MTHKTQRLTDTIPLNTAPEREQVVLVTQRFCLVTIDLGFERITDILRHAPIPAEEREELTAILEHALSHVQSDVRGKAAEANGRWQ